MEPIATKRHTLILALIFLIVAAAGAYSRARGGMAGASTSSGSAGPSVYLSVMVAELALIYYVWRGTRRHLSAPIATLVGPRWDSVGAFVRDLFLAAALWGSWLGLEFVLSRILPSTHDAAGGLLPVGMLNQSLWVMLSIFAGVAEEIVFRGYFMSQMRALTGRTWAALLLQAALFSVAHGYQGFSACVKIAGFGILFGLVALWQRNLRACIIAHAWTDIAAGLLRI